jgi:hypothetical protein
MTVDGHLCGKVDVYFVYSNDQQVYPNAPQLGWSVVLVSVDCTRICRRHSLSSPTIIVFAVLPPSPRLFSLIFFVVFLLCCYSSYIGCAGKQAIRGWWWNSTRNWGKLRLIEPFRAILESTAKHETGNDFLVGRSGNLAVFFLNNF